MTEPVKVPPPPAVGAAQGRDTKAHIHRAAIELFSSQGYDKTSLREIAERVGITKASLYYHYSSKQDLLRAIVGSFFDEMAAVMARAVNTEWTPDDERRVLTEYLDVVISHRETGPTMLRDFGVVLAAFEDRMTEILDLGRQFHTWLAGPDASVADRLRAAAVTEVPGAVLSSSVSVDEATDDEVREALLDAISAILARRDGARRQGS